MCLAINPLGHTQAGGTGNAHIFSGVFMMSSGIEIIGMFLFSESSHIIYYFENTMEEENERYNSYR
jgi:hypothetical protein